MRNNPMLSQSQRTTILELNRQGVSKRQIARVLGVSRLAVRRVLRSNSSQVTELHRPEKAEPYRQQSTPRAYHREARDGFAEGTGD